MYKVKHGNLKHFSGLFEKKKEDYLRLFSLLTEMLRFDPA